MTAAVQILNSIWQPIDPHRVNKELMRGAMQSGVAEHPAVGAIVTEVWSAEGSSHAYWVKVSDQWQCLAMTDVEAEWDAAKRERWVAAARPSVSVKAALQGSGVQVAAGVLYWDAAQGQRAETRAHDFWRGLSVAAQPQDGVVLLPEFLSWLSEKGKFPEGGLLLLHWGGQVCAVGKCASEPFVRVCHPAWLRQSGEVGIAVHEDWLLQTQALYEGQSRVRCSGFVVLAGSQLAVGCVGSGPGKFGGGVHIANLDTVATATGALVSGETHWLHTMLWHLARRGQRQRHLAWFAEVRRRRVRLAGWQCAFFAMLLALGLQGVAGCRSAGSVEESLPPHRWQQEQMRWEREHQRWQKRQQARLGEAVAIGVFAMLYEGLPQGTRINAARWQADGVGTGICNYTLQVSGTLSADDDLAPFDDWLTGLSASSILGAVERLQLEPVDGGYRFTFIAEGRP